MIENTQENLSETKSQSLAGCLRYLLFKAATEEAVQDPHFIRDLNELFQRHIKKDGEFEQKTLFMKEAFGKLVSLIKSLRKEGVDSAEDIKMLVLSPRHSKVGAQMFKDAHWLIGFFQRQQKLWGEEQIKDKLLWCLSSDGVKTLFSANNQDEKEVYDKDRQVPSTWAYAILGHFGLGSVATVKRRIADYEVCPSFHDMLLPEYIFKVVWPISPEKRQQVLEILKDEKYHVVQGLQAPIFEQTK